MGQTPKPSSCTQAAAWGLVQDAAVSVVSVLSERLWPRSIIIHCQSLPSHPIIAALGPKGSRQRAPCCRKKGNCGHRGMVLGFGEVVYPVRSACIVLGQSFWGRVAGAKLLGQSCWGRAAGAEVYWCGCAVAPAWWPPVQPRAVLLAAGFFPCPFPSELRGSNSKEGPAACRLGADVLLVLQISPTRGSLSWDRS